MTAAVTMAEVSIDAEAFVANVHRFLDAFAADSASFKGGEASAWLAACSLWRHAGV